MKLAHNRADVLVVGGGLGGVAAALAVLRRGRTVLLTEETDWLGGQLTTQAVPPDEHPWIERFGCTASYRELRDGIREYHRRWYPLSERARAARFLNPGEGTVSPLCHEPRVAAAVIDAMLAPWIAAGRLRVLLGHRPVAAEVDGDQVRAVVVEDPAGNRVALGAPYVLDATELGDLLPLTGTEHVTGFESQAETGEPHAPAQAQPANMQAFSWCFALEHRAGENHTIDKPDEYNFWSTFRPDFWGSELVSLTAPDPRTLAPYTRTFIPNPATDGEIVADQSVSAGDSDLWIFRRIVSRRTFAPGLVDSDVTLVNWPMIDYFLGPLIGVGEEEKAKHLASSRQLSLSMLYWLQTEAPRPDGGTGWPGLRLRGDVLGTADGFAKAPYIRESRRIRAEYTVVEQDLSLEIRGERGSVVYPDSVGVGAYRIDLHPSTGMDNYIDVGSTPFHVPLGALLPVRTENLLAASKNIGTTHITNGCYRMHPTEWNIGEVAGALAAHCQDNGLTPRQVRADPRRLEGFRAELAADGVELGWPRIGGY
ncbi:FAD-dependent oxidoreductase [Plantactinospora mayteni]|uniref:FAD-dependent oxidoreductase n=1 Tax=Plantactinospora mayteni TaxID=566021 RepID=A0ABQ4F1A1_9ACTN|nr:FAD-dependent oxidoreductase [Plantactinospora mayteni]GIH00688.1 FAD-dependent oxidoreductase [Plantactinospora mayteni]